MSVKYIKVKNNRKGSTTLGKVYGRAVVTNTVYTDTICENIGKRCTLTEPDIKAAVSALETEIANQLAQGNRVVLDGFGAFKVGLTTKPADTAAKFTANNVKGMHIIFQPSIEMQSGKRVKTMLKGVKVEELAEYDGLKDGSTSGGSTPSQGGSSSTGGSGSSSTGGSGSSSTGGSGSGSTGGSGSSDSKLDNMD